MLYSLEYELQLCEELKDANVNSNTFNALNTNYTMSIGTKNTLIFAV